MASAAFTAINAGGSVTYTEGGSLSYATTGKFCAVVKPGGKMRHISTEYTAGLDGAGTKDFGFRNQRIELELIYVQSSETNCLNEWDSDAGIFNKVCSLTINGITYGTCRQIDAQAEQPKWTGLPSVTTYRMNAKIVMEWVR